MQVTWPRRKARRPTVSAQPAGRQCAPCTVLDYLILSEKIVCCTAHRVITDTQGSTPSMRSQRALAYPVFTAPPANRAGTSCRHLLQAPPAGTSRCDPCHGLPSGCTSSLALWGPYRDWGEYLQVTWVGWAWLQGNTGGHTTQWHLVDGHSVAGAGVERRADTARRCASRASGFGCGNGRPMHRSVTAARARAAAAAGRRRQAFCTL